MQLQHAAVLQCCSAAVERWYAAAALMVLCLQLLLQVLNFKELQETRVYIPASGYAD